MIQLDEDVDFITVSTSTNNQLYSPKDSPDSPHGSADKKVVDHYLKNQVGGIARRMIQLEEDIDAINSMSNKKDNQYSPQHNPDTNNNSEDELLDALNAFIYTNNDKLMPFIRDIDVYESQSSSIYDEALLSTLTGEQRLAIDMIRRGENVYIHGNPGTGKSYLLLKLKLILSKDKNVVFLSPTGISAENITIHSYFNIDINEPYTFKQSDIPRPDVIVIDEVSMLSGELFDIISHKAMKLWNSTQAMGGCQVVLVGDFHQLPPIVEMEMRSHVKKRHLSCQYGCCPKTVSRTNKIGNRGYCFQAKTWRDLSLRNVSLTEAKRQTDPFFYSVLNKIRAGDQLDDKELEYIQQCKTKQPQTLFGKNESADEYNRKKYRKIKTIGEETYFKAIQQHPCGITFEEEETIKLKVGAEVFLDVNLRLYSAPYLVRGSRGVVKSFASVVDVIQQLRVELDSISENNTLYDYITCLIDVLTKAKDDDLTDRYPIIEFKDQENKPFRRCILPFRKNDYNKTEIIMPLTYAWGLTIYKSQGLSFDSLSVDLKYCRELSTAYVALSRCKDASKLHIENIHILKGLINTVPDPKVKTFYESGESELWTNDNIDDYFSEIANFKCSCCGGSSKICYDDYENLPMERSLRTSRAKRRMFLESRGIVYPLTKNNLMGIGSQGSATSTSIPCKKQLNVVDFYLKEQAGGVARKMIELEQDIEAIECIDRMSAGIVKEVQVVNDNINQASQDNDDGGDDGDDGDGDDDIYCKDSYAYEGYDL